jgi:alpha-glucosidase
VHYQDNGEDFAYENGCYNEYQFTQNAAGGVTTTLRHEGYPKYPEIVVKKI